MNAHYEHLSELLGRLQLEDFKEFVHRCIDDMCGRKGPDRLKFGNCGKWTADEFFLAHSELKSFIIDTVIHQYNFEKMQSMLSLSVEYIQGLTTCLSVRNDEIQEVLLDSFSKTPGVSLQDFDWKLKWVMGSSTLSSIEEPLLQLDLFIKEEHECVPLLSNATAQCISVELNQDSLVSIINCLDIANENFSL